MQEARAVTITGFGYKPYHIHILLIDKRWAISLRYIGNPRHPIHQEAVIRRHKDRLVTALRFYRWPNIDKE